MAKKDFETQVYLYPSTANKMTVLHAQYVLVTGERITFKEFINRAAFCGAPYLVLEARKRKA